MSLQQTTAAESRAYVDAFHEQGYAVIRGFFSPARMQEVQAETRRIYREGLKHHASYRDHNLYFDILPEAHNGTRYVLQAHWFSWISPLFEALRRDPAYLDLLEPLLSSNIKQIAQQIHWKPPGAGLTGFRLHQDLRFRPEDTRASLDWRDYITTGLAIDPASKKNGCLRVIPGSHKLGYLGLSDEGDALMKGLTAERELEAAGLDPASIVDVELEPGDIVMWSLLTVHGSRPNTSDRDRAFALSSYTRAAQSPRGEWAFRDGHSVPLGPEPQVCKYLELHQRPGPFYEDERWYA